MAHLKRDALDQLRGVPSDNDNIADMRKVSKLAVSFPGRRTCACPQSSGYVSFYRQT
jgi:hypothetical protein